MISSPSRRFLAYVLDSVIGCTLVALFSVVVGVPAMFIGSGNASDTASGLVAVYGLIMAVVMFLVQYHFWKRGTSIGKSILHMKVVDKNTLVPVGFWKMLLREMILKQVSSMIFGLGYIWILFDKDRQSWHDKILSTIVVDMDKMPVFDE